MTSSSAGYEPLGQHPHSSSSSLRRSRGPLHLVITHVPPLLAALLCAVALVFSILPPTGPAALGKSDPWLKTSTKPLPVSARNTLALSESVCAKEFPLLYPQLEELKQYWKRRGGISKRDVDDLERAASGQNNWGWARVIIRDGKVYIRSLRKGVDTRLTAILMLLHDAVSADPGSYAPGSGDQPLPPIDLILSVGDKEGFPGDESGPAWVLAKLMADRRSEGNWLSPDFGFSAWPEARAPSYPEVVELNRQVEEQVGGWAGKDDRAFWRGLPNWYPIRNDLMSRTKAASILPANHPDAWADIFPTTFWAQDPGDYKPLVALQDHCSRKYLVHSEGNSYSGRSKYLYSCHSVTISHKMEWTQHFHPALVSDPLSPAQNYVEVTGPLFEGLEEVVRGMWEADGDPKAKGVEGWWHKATQKDMVGWLPPEKIADNARDSLRDRYLTPAATACYYRAALRAYASVQNPSTWSPTGPLPQAGNGVPPLPQRGANGTNTPLVGDAGAVGDISWASWTLTRGTAKGDRGRESDWPPPEPEHEHEHEDQKGAVKVAVIGTGTGTGTGKTGASSTSRSTSSNSSSSSSSSRGGVARGATTRI